MERVLIIDPQFEGEPDVETEVTGGLYALDIVRAVDSPAELAALARADAVVNCRSRHRLPAALVARMERARIVVQAGVGYDHIDIDACAARGIAVCNTPDYGTMEVADHAIALVLDLMRGTTAYNARLLRRDDAWATKELPLPPVRRLRGLVFGVVGLGRIGLATALRARGFQFDVMFHDPYLPAGAELSPGFRRADTLEELLAAADVVSLHCPGGRDTYGLIDRAAVARMKPGAVLVNTARGRIVDLDAVEWGLREGPLGAVALDVLPEEPLTRTHPLIAAWSAGAPWLEGRMLLTPHAAFYTPESLRDMRRLSMLAVVQYLAEGRLRSCVNLEQLRAHAAGATGRGPAALPAAAAMV
jgi:phosphoglycerate dehydrogenase-like enzyme